MREQRETSTNNANVTASVVSKWYEDTYKNGKLKIIVLNQEKNAKKQLL